MQLNGQNGKPSLSHDVPRRRDVPVWGPTDYYPDPEVIFSHKSYRAAISGMRLQFFGQ